MNLSESQKNFADNFDDELKNVIRQMASVWLNKPFHEKLNTAPSKLKQTCQYFELDYSEFCRILRNNGILDDFNQPTEFGLNTGLVMRTPFSNPNLN